MVAQACLDLSNYLRTLFTHIVLYIIRICMQHVFHIHYLQHAQSDSSLMCNRTIQNAFHSLIRATNRMLRRYCVPNEKFKFASTRFWYFWQHQADEAQASLRIHTVSSETSLPLYEWYGSRCIPMADPNLLVFSARPCRAVSTYKCRK